MARTNCDLTFMTNPTTGDGTYDANQPTAEQLAPVLPWIISEMLRTSRNQGYSVYVADTMQRVLHPVGDVTFRDSAGYDVNGRDRDGFNEDGYDRNGRTRVDIAKALVEGWSEEHRTLMARHLAAIQAAKAAETPAATA